MTSPPKPETLEEFVAQWLAQERIFQDNDARVFRLAQAVAAFLEPKIRKEAFEYVWMNMCASSAIQGYRVQVETWLFDEIKKLDQQLSGEGRGEKSD